MARVRRPGGHEPRLGPSVSCAGLAAGKVLRVQRDAIRLKNESGDLMIGRIAQSTRVARRHFGAEVIEQLADALATPLRGKGCALQRRSELAVIQISIRGIRRSFARTRIGLQWLEPL